MIRARIVKRIREQLKGAAADRAMGLLDHYLAFREASRGLSAAPDSDLEARLEAIRKLGRARFGAGDADKLFGAEERRQAVAIAEQRVQQDASLSPEARKLRLAELEAQVLESFRGSSASGRRRRSPHPRPVVHS